MSALGDSIPVTSMFVPHGNKTDRPVEVAGVTVGFARCSRHMGRSAS